MTKLNLKIKRIYDFPTKDDGCRFLVDRLWPRGITKARATIDSWCKDIAPSSELRKWFAHKEENFQQFSNLYTEELMQQKAVLKEIKQLARTKPVTLLYAAKDPKINHAIVLKQAIEQA